MNKDFMETMLTPTIASIALLCVCVLLLIVVPIMDGSEKFAKFISLRYILIAMSLIMALGCVLDFSHLAESSRNIVLTGSVALVGIFVIVRSLEKVKLGGKTIELTAKKGDMEAGMTISGEKIAENQSQEKKLICENADCSNDKNKAA